MTHGHWLCLPLPIFVFLSVAQASGPGSVNAPAPYCTSTVGLSQLVQAVEPINNSIGSSFSFACKNEKVRTMTMPGAFARTVPAADDKGNSTRQFLLNIAHRVKKRLDDNKEENQKILACRLELEKEACTGIRDEVSAQVQLAKDARSYLAVIKGLEGSLAIGAPAVSQENLPETYKTQSWDPFTQREISEGQSLARQVREMAIQKSQPDSPFFNKYIQSEKLTNLREQDKLRIASHLRENLIQSARVEAETEYRLALAENPPLMYMKSQSPTSQEFFDAVEEFEKNRKLEAKKIDDLIAALSLPQTQTNSDHMDLLQYRPLVEAELIANPKFCSLADAISIVQKNRVALKMTLLTAPILAASLLMPVLPVVAAGVIGVGATAYAAGGAIYWVVDRQQAFDKVRLSREIGTKDDQATIFSNQVDEAMVTRDMEITMAAIPMLAAGRMIMSRGGIVRALLSRKNP